MCRSSCSLAVMPQYVPMQVCQKADQYYSCGTSHDPIWMQQDWPRDTKEDYPNWDVQYLDGTSFRISMFKFIVDHNIKKPKVSFINEDPPLQYVSS